MGVAFPILSRNRFSLLLEGIAAGVKKVVLVLSYPADEVGNHLVSLDQLDEAGIDPWHDVLDLEQFRAAFGKVIHPFTGVDYVDYYKGIIEKAGALRRRSFSPTACRPCSTTRMPSSAATSTPAAQQAPARGRGREGRAGPG